jgi:hypothetical protein
MAGCKGARWSTRAQQETAKSRLMFNFVNVRPLRAIQSMGLTSLAAALDWHRKMEEFNFQHGMSHKTEGLGGNKKRYSKIREVPSFILS